MLGFILGMIVGGFFGVIIMALIVVGNQADSSINTAIDISKELCIIKGTKEDEGRYFVYDKEGEYICQITDVNYENLEKTYKRIYGDVE